MEPPRKKRKIEKLIRPKRNFKIHKNLYNHRYRYPEFILNHFTRVIYTIKIQSVARMFLVKKKIERTLSYINMMITILEYLILLR